MMLTCPNCGRELVQRESEYGKFLACPGFPDCKFTRPLLKRCPKCKNTGWLDDGKGIIPCSCQRKPPPKCKACLDTGLLPFVKDGKVIPNASVYCECHDPDPPGFKDITPDDFDFSISYDFHRSLCREFGWRDPGSCEPVEQVSGFVDQVPEWNHRQWDRVQQLQGEVNHLHREVIDLSKRRQKPDWKSTLKE